MSSPGCPEISEISLLLAGRLPEARHEALIRHVDGCQNCQARVDDLGSAPVARSREIVPSDSEEFEREPECRNVVSLLERAMPTDARGPALGDPPKPSVVGPYEIEAEIGRGGMGIVYRARDTRLNRAVALKTIRRGLMPTRAELLRFRAEAETAAALDHPGIVPIYEVGGDDDSPYFVMALIEGRSLADLVSRGPLPARLAASYVKSAAHAVAFAHGRGVIHRDLKPANILLDRSGEPRISDFGLAKRADVGSDLTGTGEILGTPGYMPPEQADGGASGVGPLSDVYSLGATLYCLLTGRPPFQAASKIEAVRQVLERDPVPPRQLDRAIPRDLETICLKCLEKPAHRRYASADALADDLERFLDGRPIHARPVGFAGLVLRGVRRKPLVAALASALVLACVIGFAGIVWKWREADARAVAERWQVYRAEMGRAASEYQASNLNSARAALDDAPADHRGWEWRHFASQLDRSARSASPTGAQVAWVAIHPDGQRIISAQGDGSVATWDPKTGRIASTRPGVSGMPTFAVVKDSPRVAIKLDDGSVVLWDPDRKTNEVLFREPQTRAMWIAAHPARGRVYAGINDGRFLVWDASTAKLIATHPGHDPTVGGMTVSSDGHVACGWGDGHVRIWDPETGKSVRFETGQGTVNAMAFSPNSRVLATGHAYPTNAVGIFDAADGRVIGITNDHEDRVNAISFSPDGRLVVSASMDKTARLRDAATAKTIAVLRGHSGQVQQAAFGPDGRRVVTASRDGLLRLWDVATTESVAVLGGHRDLVADAVWSRDGRQIVSGSFDGTVRSWDVPTLERDGVLRGHTNFVYGVTWLPDGERLMSLAWDGTARTWDVGTQREVTRESYADQLLSGMDLTRDGRKLAVVRGDNHIEVRDLGGNAPPWVIESHTGFWRARPHVAFSPDGSRLVAGGMHGTVTVWDVARRTASHNSVGDALWQVGVAFSPDGRLIASAGEDGRIRLWDAESLRQVGEMTGHTSLVNRLVFSPDGRTLASTSEDRTARLWDVARRVERASLTHDGIVYAVAFSPDGQRLATGCSEDTIRLWDVATGGGLVELRGHRSYVHALAFSPDGTRLASASGDRTVRVWDTLRAEERARLNGPR